MSDTASQPRDRLAASLGRDYLIERELGTGGMATVYLAHDVRHDRRVALKVLRPELAAVIGAARFLQEIRTVANLQHPHILPLFDSGNVEGTVFYVMPFVEGESLRDRLQRERQLPIDDAIRIAGEVASALDYAHRRGILHRDIKPENILLQDGTALVADFGIALAVSRSDAAPRLTETGMSLGTPHYMSPEQAMGERTLDARTDIYSLGCVVYEMLAGEPPFTGPSAQAIIARVVTEEPRSLQAQRRTISPHVEAAVECALEKLPADRFATAGQFADALAAPGRTALRTGTSSRQMAPPAVAARRPMDALRSWAPWALTALALAFALIVTFRARESAEITRHRIALWEQPIAPGTLSHRLAISPDGAMLAFVDSVDGTRQIWFKNRREADPVRVAGTEGAIAPTFSPSGEWLAFIADGRLRKVPTSGGAAVTVADSANATFPAIAWLDDGTILFNDNGYSLVQVSENGGTPRRVLPASARTRGVASITALPGSRGALVGTCTFGCPDVDLRAVNLRTGESSLLSTDVVKGWYLPGGRLVYVRRDGAVFTSRFDLRKLQMRGAPTPVMAGVRTGIGEPDIVIAPNGTMIYAPGRGEEGGVRFQPVWVSRDGTAAPVDSGWAYTPSGNGGVAISPDGRRLAVSVRAAGSEDIWIKELGGGPVTRLTVGGFNIRPEWSIDGRTVYYVSTPSEGDALIRMRRSDGSAREETVLDLERAVFEIARTGHPEEFLVRLGTPPSRDIMLWRRGVPGPDSLRPLVASSEFDEIAPALSPNGRWLAYVSNESGRNEVYVRPFPDVESGRWQISRTGGAEPVWTSAGTELFYRDGAGDILAVPISTADSFATGQQRVLFSSKPYRSGLSRHESYDVTPDGKFVFTREVTRGGEAENAPLIQVENWFAALREAEARR